MTPKEFMHHWGFDISRSEPARELMMQHLQEMEDAAVEAERERNCNAVCPLCAEGVPIVIDKHGPWHKSRGAICKAAAIRKGEPDAH